MMQACKPASLVIAVDHGNNDGQKKKGINQTSRVGCGSGGPGTRGGGSRDGEGEGEDLEEREKEKRKSNSKKKKLTCNYLSGITCYLPTYVLGPFRRAALCVLTTYLTSLLGF